MIFLNINFINLINNLIQFIINNIMLFDKIKKLHLLIQMYAIFIWIISKNDTNIVFNKYLNKKIYDNYFNKFSKYKNKIYKKRYTITQIIIKK